jgi:hypothetical protein
MKDSRDGSSMSIISCRTMNKRRWRCRLGPTKQHAEHAKATVSVLVLVAAAEKKVDHGRTSSHPHDLTYIRYVTSTVDINNAEYHAMLALFAPSPAIRHLSASANRLCPLAWRPIRCGVRLPARAGQQSSIDEHHDPSA